MIANEYFTVINVSLAGLGREHVFHVVGLHSGGHTSYTRVLSKDFDTRQCVRKQKQRRGHNMMEVFYISAEMKNTSCMFWPPLCG